MVSLGNSALEGKIMLAMVRNSLFNEEIQRKDFVSNDTHALVMENRSRSKSKGPSGHNKSRGRSTSRGKIKCYHCGKIGHMKRTCKCKTREKSKFSKIKKNGKIVNYRYSTD